MKYLDYAAMGAASSAYGEASRAQAGVNQLWNEIQLIKHDINSQKYEREFQKWVEELIYQFDKTVTAISESPGNPMTDGADLASFFRIIEENNLDTSLITGLENKKEFEKTLLRAKPLFQELQEKPEVRNYLDQQNRDRYRDQQEKLLAEKDKKRKAFILKIIVWILMLASIPGMLLSAVVGSLVAGICFLIAFAQALYYLFLMPQQLNNQ
jgi:hypothetical protein